MKNVVLFGLTGTAVFAGVANGLSAAESTSTPEKPNVLIIYADDLGYGDLSCYGAHAVQTPNIDRLAKEGIRFTTAYASAATCTPSRYSILTGQNSWRKAGTQILPGDAKLIIEPGRQTLASVMKNAGYATGIVGKWHLGLGAGDSPVNWNAPVSPSPREVGFDYSHIMAATNDRVPCVYLENGTVQGLDPKDPISINYKKKIGNDPTGRENPELLKLKHSHGHDMTIVNGVGRIGWMSGGHAARWRDEDMADLYLRKSSEFMTRAVEKKEPFFLMFTASDIHVPRLPHERFIGKSKLGSRGDLILQFDWCVGELLKKLDALGVSKNTIVILSSDNGPVLDDGYADSAVVLNKAAGHKPSGILRGGKYSTYDGGCRVPFIVRAPEQIKNPGTISRAMISQLDLLASFAEMNGQHADKTTAGDSLDMRRALFGEDTKGRDFVVMRGTAGLALRYGDYNYIPGGKKKSGKMAQLYNVKEDPSESVDIAGKNPELIKKFQKVLDDCTGGKVFLN